MDGNGLSEIVALFILTEETKETIQTVLNVFIVKNESWEKTKVIMSDKDFVEMEVFKDCFTNASLLICLYHTLRSFRREVTCEKMGITSAERLHTLEILEKIAYTKNDPEYAENVESLQKTKFKSVADYYYENWHPVKEQWVLCYKDLFPNLGETTNNRLESSFSKIKSVCGRYSTLLQFFMDFSSALGTLRNERNHHYIMSFARRDVKFEAVDVRYRSFAEKLTDYAHNCVKAKIVLAETAKFDIIQVGENTYKLKGKCNEFTVTRKSCTCNFLKKMGLPCEHVLALRMYLHEPAFDSNLIHQRWTKEYYQNALDTRFKTSEGSAEKVSVNVSNDQRRCTLTQAQKYKKINKVCQQITSVASESGMRQFQNK